MQSPAFSAVPNPYSNPFSHRLRSLLVLVIGCLGLLGPVMPAAGVYIRHDRPVGFHNAIGSRPTFATSGFLADRDGHFNLGSGTLVAPTKVLTAAHIFDADGNLKPDDPTAVKRLSFGTDRFIPSSLRANVKSIAINPGYLGGNNAYDLAVLTLRTPFHYVAPGQLSSAYSVGRRGAMVGYGFQGTGIGWSVSGAEDKFGAFNEISLLKNGTYRTDFDNPAGTKSSFGSARPLTYEGTTAPGDSGSALWADFGNNRWAIVGVLSGGFNPKGEDSQYGDVSIFSSLANAGNVAFLQSQGLQIGNPTGIPSGALATGMPSSLSAVPEPTAAAVLLPIAAGLLLRRRSRH